MADSSSPKRGAPVKDPKLRRTEKLGLSFTATHMRQMMTAAAQHPDGPKDVKRWATDILLATISTKKE